MAERHAAEVFPPGEFLRDELEARGWTQTELADIIGRPPRVINEIIASRRAITPETARDFAAAFETSAQFWMNLETAYQLSKVPPRDEGVSREATLRDRFPVREMIKRGWIRKGLTAAELEEAILSFFEIENVDAPVAFAHAARRNHGEALSKVQWCWLCRIRRLAKALRTARFSADRVVAAMPKLEALMLEPEQVRLVPRVLAEAGIRLIVVEPVPASKIQGACFWLDDESPVIGLSLKGDHIDRFWFNLWHEVAHVLHSHGKSEIMVDNFDESDDLSDEREILANKVAADHCVPSDAMSDFIQRHDPMYSEKTLVGFSRLVNRHPGIVAGQIQNATGRWDLFRKYQVRVRDHLIEGALTDGYGKNPPLDL